MKIVGFVKMHNEAERGNLERCLKNLKKYCSNIVIYDSGSTDNSVEVAKKYTDYIITGKDDFKAELLQKQELLEYALKLKPEWIFWIDPDEILEKRGFEGIKKLCKFGDTFGVDGFAFHEINLWRSECWYRLDNQFNNKWDIRLWKAKPELKFNTSLGLHRPQHPLGLQRILPCNLQIIHYGFSTVELIVQKYKTYKALGQTGWALSRLIDERTLKLAPVNIQWFDKTPKLEPMPKPLSMEKWKKLVA